MPKEKIDVNTMLWSYNIYLKGSQFIVHTSLVNIFEKLYENKLVEWSKFIVCDDDQTLVLQIYYDNRGLFQLIQDNEWFSLFRKHLNQF